MMGATARNEAEMGRWDPLYRCGHLLSDGGGSPIGEIYDNRGGFGCTPAQIGNDRPLLMLV